MDLVKDISKIRNIDKLTKVEATMREIKEKVIRKEKSESKLRYQERENRDAIEGIHEDLRKIKIDTGYLKKEEKKIKDETITRLEEKQRRQLEIEEAVTKLEEKMIRNEKNETKLRFQERQNRGAIREIREDLRNQEREKLGAMEGIQEALRKIKIDTGHLKEENKRIIDEMIRKETTEKETKTRIEEEQRRQLEIEEAVMKLKEEMIRNGKHERKLRYQERENLSDINEIREYLKKDKKRHRKTEGG